MTTMPVLRVGELAYYDSMNAGRDPVNVPLIPVKVTKILNPESDYPTVLFEVCEDTWRFRKGDKLYATHRVLPRECCDETAIRYIFEYERVQ